MKSLQNKADGPLLVVTVEGAEVRNGRIEAEHLAKVLEVLQKSLRCFAIDLLKDNGSRVSRQDRTLIKKYSTFEVIGFAAGSFSINLTLPEGYHSKDSSWAETGRHALMSMVNGLRVVARNGEGRDGLTGNLAKSLAPFAKMATLLHNGIQQLRLSVPETGLSAVLNENVCRSLGRISFEEECSELESEPRPPRVEPSGSEKLTAETLLHSPLIGIWSDRTDITDSSEFARELRDKAGSRER